MRSRAPVTKWIACRGLSASRISGVLRDVPESARADRDEPQRAHRPEQQADHAGAVLLDHEQRDQDAGRNRHHVRLERGGADLEPLDRRQHRNRRRQHRVAVEQRRAEQRRCRAAPHAAAAARAIDRGGEREQRHDAALAAVAGAQHQRHVLERDDDHQRPEDRRDAAENVIGGERNAVVRIEGFLDCVQRAGADVAVDDAERQQRQRRGRLLRDVCIFGRRSPRVGAGCRRRRGLLVEMFISFAA